MKPLHDHLLDEWAPDALDAEVENGALRDLIFEEIAASGPLTFRRFMELVLYHPQEGYYSSSRQQIGRSGDYLTSPEISPLFGYALAKQAAELWRCLGSPASFDLVEAGAGNGSLARDILRWSAARAASFHVALRLQIVETSAALRERQRQSLARWLVAGKVAIHAELKELAPESINGCVFANELLDSFPVHRVAMHHSRLEEIYIDCAEGRLVECNGPLSTPSIECYFERLGLLPGEGCTVEVNLAASAWLAEAAARLAGGFIFLLDYGYDAARLYARWRRNGTLLTYHRHTSGEDPYLRIGRQDLTTHVDFTTLRLAAQEAGLQEVGRIDQARLLTNLGINDALRLDGANGLAMEEYYARRRAVAELLDPTGLGRVQAILFAKAVPAFQPQGFQTAAVEQRS